LTAITFAVMTPITSVANPIRGIKISHMTPQSLAAMMGNETRAIKLRPLSQVELVPGENRTLA
jgi:hypothetical protein